MDIILLAVLNVILFVGIAMGQYFHYIKRKELFFRSIPHNRKSSLNKLYLFLPSALYVPATKLVTFLKEKAENKNTKNDFSPSKVAIFNIALLVTAINLQNVLKIQWYVVVLIGLGIQAFLFMAQKNKEQKIKEEIEKKLPEILEIMARVYRVHTDLRITLREVANNIHEPIVKNIFNEIVKLSRFGYTVEEAMEHVAKEINSPDFNFIVTSIKLNIPVGGDLSKLFENTSKLLRQRKEAKNEIQNLMFQSKISSIISALLVPAIIVVAFTSSKKYQEVLLYNPTGRLVFFSCLIWWLIGVVMIRNNSRVKI